MYVSREGEIQKRYLLRRIGVGIESVNGNGGFERKQWPN
jgi:hypothetical protein